jgi:hypothetical protein
MQKIGQVVVGLTKTHGNKGTLLSPDPVHVPCICFLFSNNDSKSTHIFQFVLRM